MRVLVYISIIGVLFFGCKKYPEDDRRYLFKSPMQRITSHNWKVKYFYIDGVDSTNKEYIRDFSWGVSTSYRYSDFTMSFSKNYYEKGPLGNYRVLKIEPAYFSIATPCWYFSDDKKEMALFLEKSNTSILFLRFNVEQQGWIIKKLTEKELIIESKQTTRHLKLCYEAI